MTHIEKLKTIQNRSKHYGDVTEWIKKVIDSCETHQQTLTTYMLIYNFKDQMTREKVDIDLRHQICSTLNFQLRVKQKNIDYENLIE